MRRKCKTCGREYESDAPNRRYCSEECCKQAYVGYMREYRKKHLYKRVCRNCGREYETRDWDKKYCSRECRKSAQQVEKICGNCGVEFKPAHENQKYCSEECQRANRNKKRRERRRLLRKVFKCERCGEEFQKKYPNQKNCEVCMEARRLPEKKVLSRRRREQKKRYERGLAYKPPKLKKICEVCGKVFETYHARRRYCSPKCEELAQDW